VAFAIDFPSGQEGRAEGVGGGFSARLNVGSGPLGSSMASRGSDAWKSSDSADPRILSGIPPSPPPSAPLAAPPAPDHTTLDFLRDASLHSGEYDTSEVDRPDLGAGCVSASRGETHQRSRSRHEVVNEPELGAEDDGRAHAGCEGVDLVDHPKHSPRARYDTPGKGPTSLQRQYSDFHTIPSSCVSTVPEMGLQGVIRLHAASIQTYGAHVFRIEDPKIRPASCVAPKRKVGVRVRVRVQTSPQYPTIVSDVFSRSPDPDPTVKRGELRAQLPPEREKWLLADDLKKKIRDSKAALLEQYHEFGVPQFLACVNDPNVTWVRRRASGGHETKVMGPGKPKPVDVYYVSDLTPSNEDGCDRSLGDPACSAKAVPFPPSERLESPRTLNHHSMLGDAATYEGINTKFLYMGTTGSHFSWHVEHHLLQSVSYLQSGASKLWFFIANCEVLCMVRVLVEHMDPVALEAAGGDVWQVLGLTASLWPASFFLEHGVHVSFHKMGPGEFFVTGYGVPHSGLNAGVNVASTVNLACTSWLVHAIEHAMHWRGKLGMLIPVEKLLVLNALKLADGKWWFGDAIA